jgi:hypothetical protein
MLSRANTPSVPVPRGINQRSFSIFCSSIKSNTPDLTPVGARNAAQCQREPSDLELEIGAYVRPPIPETKNTIDSRERVEVVQVS